MKKIILILVIVLVVGGAYYYFSGKPAEAPKENNQIQQSNQLDWKVLASDYIKANISFLSPEKESLGGKFFVTSINFGEKYSGIVNYEDGHNAYSATFDYFLPDGSDKINIINFKLLTASSGPNDNFSKEGNLTRPASPKGTGMWFLIYEEPGKPALDVELKFTEKSLCTSGQETVYCSSFNFNSGDRIKVSGFREGKSVTVSRFIKIR